MKKLVNVLAAVLWIAAAAVWSYVWYTQPGFLFCTVALANILAAVTSVWVAYPHD